MSLQKSVLPCAFPAVGINATVQTYADEMLDEPNTCAYLFHGMGGIGKSTLAKQLFADLEEKSAGRFGKRVYSVIVQRQFVSNDNIPQMVEQAQQNLLELVSNKNTSANSSLAERRSCLETAFAKLGGPVLLIVDNVPESGGGIQGMLPHNLLSCLPAR
jgi:hypothetical protein